MSWFPKIVYILILSFVYCSIFNNEPMVKNADNYGVYALSFQHYGECKGPKSKNLTILNTKMNDELIAFINFTFLVDARIEEIKVQVYNVKDNKKSFLWGYKFNDPCKQFAIGALIKQHLNAKNCLVKKGFYGVRVDYREITNSFLGTSFFYGTYIYKSVLTSKQGNIACLNSTQTFAKKDI